MKELLERIAKVMPEGWKIAGPPRYDGWHLWQVPWEDAPPFILYPNYGDIGLAPLTALLKQDMGAFSIERGWFDGDLFWWFCDGERSSTEFEAVAHAYLALKDDK